jgi:DNA polymerase
VTDELRRYLQLQQDLGGDEVIFDTPVDVRAALAPRQGVAESTSVPVAAAPDAPSKAIATASKGPPSIPGPGLTIVTQPILGAPAWGSLDEIAAVVRDCRKCPLCETRTHAVPGEGDPSARLMCIGEGPGQSEDLSGRPFVGRAGDLLNKMLEAISVPRAQAYIANVVKCRPPKNRVPLPDERDACMPYLHRQVALVQPKVLLALGGTATEALLGIKKSLGALRLQVHSWNGIPLIVTYHPAALLRNPDWKRPAWDDLRIVRQLLDRDT